MSSLKSKRSGKARLAFDVAEAKWTKCAKAPSENELSKKSIGVVYWFRGKPDIVTGVVKTTVYVKVEDGSERPWRHARKTSTGSALAHIEEIDERNAKRPDDYEWMSPDDDVATAIKGKGASLMTGAIGVAMREPIVRVNPKKIVLTSGKWGPAQLRDVSPSADDLGKAYRAIAATKRGPHALVYVKVGLDDWIQIVSAADAEPVAEIAEIVTRLREEIKYPRYRRMRDKEIRESLENALGKTSELTTAKVVVAFTI